MAVWQPNEEEPVKVAAWFDPMKPPHRRVVGLKFILHGQEHLIRPSQLDLYHQTHRGEALQHHFSVAEKDFHYKLRFDGKNLTWTLEGIYERF